MDESKEDVKKEGDNKKEEEKINTDGKSKNINDIKEENKTEEKGKIKSEILEEAKEKEKEKADDSKKEEKNKELNNEHKNIINTESTITEGRKEGDSIKENPNEIIDNKENKNLIKIKFDHGSASIPRDKVQKYIYYEQIKEKEEKTKKK